MSNHYTGLTFELKLLLTLIDPDLCRNFAAANVLKYLYRAKYRGEWKSDIAKAKDYCVNWLKATPPTDVQVSTELFNRQMQTNGTNYDALVGDAILYVKHNRFDKVLLLCYVAEEILGDVEF